MAAPRDLVSLFGLSGQVALVTGATSGIGRRQALALASAGARVVALGRRREQLDSLVVEIEQAGAQAAAVCLDLSAQEPAEIAQQSLSCFDSIDILCNTAGVNLREPAAQISVESWQRTLWLNLSLPFFLARELVPAMLERGRGKIINIASLQSERAFANSMAYGASKGGVAQLTRAMAEAWSASGVCCNAIGPGFFPTELTARVFADDTLSRKNAAQTAMGRNGEMDDLDGITVFLASGASDYITGQVIYVDGGFTAK